MKDPPIGAAVREVFPAPCLQDSASGALAKSAPIAVAARQKAEAKIDEPTERAMTNAGSPAVPRSLGRRSAYRTQSQGVDAMKMPGNMQAMMRRRSRCRSACSKRSP